MTSDDKINCYIVTLSIQTTDFIALKGVTNFVTLKFRLLHFLLIVT